MYQDLVLFFIGYILDSFYSRVFSHIFEAFSFWVLVSWDVLNSCFVSKLPVLFPVGAAKSTTFWWAFALLYLERGRSWHGVVWSRLKSEKDDTASLCTVIRVWKVCVSALVFFSFPWERKLKCFKNTLAGWEFRWGGWFWPTSFNLCSKSELPLFFCLVTTDMRNPQDPCSGKGLVQPL